MSLTSARGYSSRQTSPDKFNMSNREGTRVPKRLCHVCPREAVRWRARSAQSHGLRRPPMQCLRHLRHVDGAESHAAPCPSESAR